MEDILQFYLDLSGLVHNIQELGSAAVFSLNHLMSITINLGRECPIKFRLRSDSRDIFLLLVFDVCDLISY